MYVIAYNSKTFRNCFIGSDALMVRGKPQARKFQLPADAECFIESFQPMSKTMRSHFKIEPFETADELARISA